MKRPTGTIPYDVETRPEQHLLVSRVEAPRRTNLPNDVGKWETAACGATYAGWGWPERAALGWRENTPVTCERCQLIKAIGLANDLTHLTSLEDVEAMFELIAEAAVKSNAAPTGSTAHGRD